jgi:hypothetical protein
MLPVRTAYPIRYSLAVTIILLIAAHGARAQRIAVPSLVHTIGCEYASHANGSCHGSFYTVGAVYSFNHLLYSLADSTVNFYGSARLGAGVIYAHAGYSLKLSMPEWCYGTIGLSLMTMHEYINEQGYDPCRKSRARLSQMLFLTAGIGIESGLLYVEASVYQPFVRSTMDRPHAHDVWEQNRTGSISPSLLVSIGIRFSAR